MEASIIVPTYNRRNSLEATIDSLTSLEFDGDFEIIIVDGGSTDGTKKFLRDLKNNKIRPVFLESDQGPGDARNHGVEKAEGKYLLFTDDDCIVPRDWIVKHLKAHENPGIDIVNGIQYPKDFNTIEAFKTSRYWKRNSEKYVIDNEDTFHSISTNNLSYRREVFEDIGNFNEHLKRAEDTDHGYRAIEKGYNILHDSSIQVRHQKKDNLREFLRTKYSLGKSLNELHQEHGERDNPRMTPRYILGMWKFYYSKVGITKTWSFPIIAGMSMLVRILGQKLN